VKAPPGTTTIAHGVLAGWSAARVEHRGRVWKSGRELATEPDRWAVSARCERGYTKLLPDLAVWLNRSEQPVAVIAESGGRREDRQKMILEGWRDAVLSGRYSAVHFHCPNDGIEQSIRRLARKVGLSGRWFAASVQMTAAEIAALPRAEPQPDERPLPSEQPPAVNAVPDAGPVEAAAICAAPPPPPLPKELQAPRPEPESEMPPAPLAPLTRDHPGGQEVRNARTCNWRSCRIGWCPDQFRSSARRPAAARRSRNSRRGATDRRAASGRASTELQGGEDVVALHVRIIGKHFVDR
jgi:hypothetical protein